MKVRHIPRAFQHDPLFILLNGRRMLAHTFRGATWRSVFGLEDARKVFRRYRHIRERERSLVDWPDPAPAASDLSAGESSTGIPIPLLHDVSAPSVARPG